MTAHSETVRMSLYSRITTEGLNQDQQYRLFMDEMTLYRNALVHLVAEWQADHDFSALSDHDRDLQAYEALWRTFAQTGIVEQPTRAFAEENFVELDEEEAGRLRQLIIATPGLKANFAKETEAALARVNIAPSPANRALAGKLVMLARMVGAWSCRTGVEIGAMPGAVAEPPCAAPKSSPPATHPTAEDAPIAVDEPNTEWLDMTPSEVAERFIADTPRMFEHRQGGKRASEQTGEQTLRQIRWAAQLLERSLPPGKPMWAVNSENLKRLDQWFDKLPITFGKSPADRAANMTFERAHARAIERVEAGDLAGDGIGLTIPTCNKHYRKIAQIHEFLRSKLKDLPELNTSEFIQPDRKDERAARTRYTVEQGQAIFALPPWTGCAGDIIIHDSLFYVLLLVWYTGARREEICKLRIVDVDHVSGIWFLRIDTTETGRVKNTSAIRCIPIADELVRLGFTHYVEALKAAGETLVFPEIEPADGTKRKRGDVFYKLWWIYLAPLIPGLLRGQAMHSARHMVSDELKQQAIFLEFRNDLLGHKTNGGEGATRYPSAAALRTVLAIVNRIPVVTAHVADVGAADIRLLTSENRRQRPSRK
ncbi:site-specific integrase [Stakelama marina]|uniref:Site-specific integrase n=1 Tax=Stakelama marina TaxID=2826939 RepID=A0A8T4INY2_9SPHN|nr:site-specific integrase [Stakelama marina]MBR0553836.1 site-specific integrase [Stakelama marina]